MRSSLDRSVGWRCSWRRGRFRFKIFLYWLKHFKLGFESKSAQTFFLPKLKLIRWKFNIAKSRATRASKCWVTLKRVWFTKKAVWPLDSITWFQTIIPKSNGFYGFAAKTPFDALKLKWPGIHLTNLTALFWIWEMKFMSGAVQTQTRGNECRQTKWEDLFAMTKGPER